MFWETFKLVVVVIGGYVISLAIGLYLLDVSDPVWAIGVALVVGRLFARMEHRFIQ